MRTECELVEFLFSKAVREIVRIRTGCKELNRPHC